MAASSSSSESRFICFDFFLQYYLQGNANGFNSTFYNTGILNLWLAFPNHYHPSSGGAYLHRHPYTPTPHHPQPATLGSSPTIPHIHSHRVMPATESTQTKGKDGRSLKLLGVSPKSKVTRWAQAGRLLLTTYRSHLQGLRIEGEIICRDVRYTLLITSGNERSEQFYSWERLQYNAITG
jgi:hypothetical protein